jgi:hypothetical protein
MQISKHCSYSEATKSQSAIRLGIKNEPTEKQLTAMKLVAAKVFEPVREFIAKPIVISSFYRSPKVNSSIGSSSTSQHCKGEAMDLDTEKDNLKIFHYIKSKLVFDQLILEFPDKNGSPSWVHVSYSATKNRGEVLVALRTKNGTVYKSYEEWIKKQN